MFLDVKELAVHKLNIRKRYAPGNIDYHTADLKQIEPLEVVATAELIESQIRVSGQLDTKIELQCARCLDPVVEDVERRFDLFYSPMPKLTKPEEQQWGISIQSTPPGEPFAVYKLLTSQSGSGLCLWTDSVRKGTVPEMAGCDGAGSFNERWVLS